MTNTLYFHVLLVSLSLVGALKLNIDPEASFDKDETPIDFVEGKPLTKGQQDQLIQSSLQQEVQEMISKMPSNTSFIFIGDSTIRNQFLGLCALIGDPLVGTKGFVEHGEMHCESKGISATNAFTKYPTPEALQQVLKKSVKQPSVIYWNTAQLWAKTRYHKYFEGSAYSDRVKESIQNFAKLAPQSKIVFFLGHSACVEKQKKHQIPVKGPYDNAVRPDLMSELNDIARKVQEDYADGQGRPITFVDGFHLTEGKCDSTDDGIHFNALVGDEIRMLLSTCDLM